MKWEVEQSRNGSSTIKVNGIYLYSKYSPENDAKKFIDAEADPLMESYLLIGLGLGYHIEALMNKGNQTIFVYIINPIEIKLFTQYGNRDLLKNNRIVLIDMEQISDILLMDKMQVIIPLQYIKAIESGHPLFDLIDDIKTRQMSYTASKLSLAENFKMNIQNEDPSILEWYKAYRGKEACLISSGPSLNRTIDCLKRISKNCFIISVGSALKVLLMHSIVPDAVIITDPSPNVIDQIKETKYKGPLFYLSTANYHMTQIHNHDRFIIFQEGYSVAENYAKSIGVPLLETGGSVATTALSLLEYMGFQDVYLFGQDLSFWGERTHADGSTSGVPVIEKSNFRKIKANSGKIVYSTPNLQVYHRWFERKVEKTNMNVYNTSWNGAKIKGAPFINEIDLLTKISIQSSEETMG